MRGQLTASQSELFAANRAAGGVAFDVQSIDGKTRLRNLHEHGSLRVRFPSPEGEGLSAMLVNTAGGVAGGDIFDIDVTAGAYSKITLTTASAEKIYRSHGPNATINVALRVGDEACLAWVPQEAILFDRGRVSRKIDIDLAETATLLLSEIVVFGRAAMEEAITQGSIVDRWRVRRGGKLVFAETVRLDGDIASKLGKPAIANGGVAVGTALIAPGNEAVVERIRTLQDSFAGEVGVSCWNGFAMARFCAQDAAAVRADMMVVLMQAGIAPLPRVWLQ